MLTDASRSSANCPYFCHKCWWDNLLFKECRNDFATVHVEILQEQKRESMMSSMTLRWKFYMARVHNLKPLNILCLSTTSQITTGLMLYKTAKAPPRRPLHILFEHDYLHCSLSFLFNYFIHLFTYLFICLFNFLFVYLFIILLTVIQIQTLRL